MNSQVEGEQVFNFKQLESRRGVMTPGQMPVPHNQYAQIKGSTLELQFPLCSLWCVRAVWRAAPSSHWRYSLTATHGRASRPLKISRAH